MDFHQPRDRLAIRAYIRSQLRSRGLLEFADDDVETSNRADEVYTNCAGVWLENALGKTPLKIDALRATTTDVIMQSIENTLADNDDFWSSTGAGHSAAGEALLYRLRQPLSHVSYVSIAVYRAHYQHGDPLYPPRKVSFLTGPTPNQLYPASPVYPVRLTDSEQVFALSPTAPISQYLMVRLHGRLQRQWEDLQYYIAIRHVSAYGTALQPTYCSQVLRATEALGLTWPCTRSVASARAAEAGRSLPTAGSSPCRMARGPIGRGVGAVARRDDDTHRLDVYEVGMTPVEETRGLSVSSSSCNTCWPRGARARTAAGIGPRPTSAPGAAAIGSASASTAFVAAKDLVYTGPTDSELRMIVGKESLIRAVRHLVHVPWPEALLLHDTPTEAEGGGDANTARHQPSQVMVDKELGRRGSQRNPETLAPAGPLPQAQAGEAADGSSLRSQPNHPGHLSSQPGEGLAARNGGRSPSRLRSSSLRLWEGEEGGEGEPVATADDMPGPLLLRYDQAQLAAAAQELMNRLEDGEDPGPIRFEAPRAAPRGNRVPPPPRPPPPPPLQQHQRQLPAHLLSGLRGHLPPPSAGGRLLPPQPPAAGAGASSASCGGGGAGGGTARQAAVASIIGERARAQARLSNCQLALARLLDAVERMPEATNDANMLQALSVLEFWSVEAERRLANLEQQLETALAATAASETHGSSPQQSPRQRWGGVGCSEGAGASSSGGNEGRRRHQRAAQRDMQQVVYSPGRGKALFVALERWAVVGRRRAAMQASLMDSSGGNAGDGPAGVVTGPKSAGGWLVSHYDHEQM